MRFPVLLGQFLDEVKVLTDGFAHERGCGGFLAALLEPVGDVFPIGRTHEIPWSATRRHFLRFFAIQRKEYKLGPRGMTEITTYPVGLLGGMNLVLDYDLFRGSITDGQIKATTTFVCNSANADFCGNLGLFKIEMRKTQAFDKSLQKYDTLTMTSMWV